MPIYALGDRQPCIHPTAWVHPDAVLIGDVILGEQVSIWPGVVIRADNSPVRIGARSSIQDNSMLHTHPKMSTTVGEDCTVGHLVHLEGCWLENIVLIGSGAVVMSGVICRSGSLVASGSVVTKNTEVPSGALAAGVPATIRPNAVNSETILYSVKTYLRVMAEHRDRMRMVGLADCLTEEVY